MTNHDYARIWQSLDEDAGSVDSKGLLKRLIDPNVSPELHLAVSVPDKERFLLVKMPYDWTGDTSTFPRWRGASVFVHLSEERPTQGKYLAIRQGKDSAKEVFEALIADVCDAITASPDRDVEQLISDRLERWRIFFEDQRQDGLSLEAQQGLFGELHFMREYLFPAIGKAAAIRSWTGSRRANRDFQFDRSAFEVKTSSRKQHHKVIIANERQLDNAGLDELELIFVSLEIIEEAEGDLPQVVAGILDDLQDETVAVSEFRDKLLEAGYLSIHSNLYRRSYVSREVSAYRVAEGFPRILEQDLKIGVGDVSYSVMLSACERFRMPVSEAIAHIAHRNDGSPVA
jgi:hypothetical protein